MLPTCEQFKAKRRKAVTLIGMSGVGKTTLARKLPKTSWFHFSADYRIGTRYLKEPILDNIKQKAMGVGFLRDLLRSDSIYIGSAMTFDNLELLSKYVGKIGDESKGGLNFTEFKRRQDLHHDAEVAAMLDVGEFIRKAKEIYGYENFVNDASGSICELNNKRVLEHLAKHTIIVYLEASEEFEAAIVRRQVSHPKPLYYDSEFLSGKLMEYLKIENLNGWSDIDPDEFVSWIFPELVKARRPKYEMIARQYGCIVAGDDIDDVRDESDFIELICSGLSSGR